MSLLLILLIVLPLAASVLIMLGAAPRIMALGTAILNLLISVVLFARYDLTTGGWQFVSEWKILPQLGINMTLGADGLTLTMLLLAIAKQIEGLINCNSLSLNKHKSLVLLFTNACSINRVFPTRRLPKTAVREERAL
jgi:NADH:ubiquinone oxidoreductase subunit 4 (subunit M)